MEEPNLKIISQLRAILQASVDKHFGFQRPNNRSLEAAQEHAQKLLDQYIAGLMKESPELKKQWALGHPFLVLCKVSLETRSYQIIITTKDNPKGL
jgi:hypothetical protein